MSTSSSRATAPLKKVTIRTSPSERASTTNPGASRSWTAPKSRNASQTASGDASMTICFVIDSTGSPLRSGLVSGVGAAEGPVQLGALLVGVVGVDPPDDVQLPHGKVGGIGG